MFIMICKRCPKKLRCKKICPEIEAVLSGLNHSLKSNYLVKFVDPFILEASAVPDKEPKGLTMAQRKRQEELYVEIEKRLRKLSKIIRLCIRYYYGLKGEDPQPQREIAKRLGVSQNTVSYHLVQAKKYLKVIMIDLV